MNTGIYVIANKATGKCYVGSSVDVSRRWKRHLYDLRNERHHSEKLQRSFQKHGEGVFSHSFVESCSPDEFVEKEQFWMDHLDSCSNGYNVCPKACLIGHLPKNEDHRRRIGEAHLGKKLSADTKQKISAALRGKKRQPLSSEVKGKLSMAKKGRAMSEEAKAKLSAAKRGVKTGPCSDSRREAISKAKRIRDAAKKECQL